MICNKCGIEMGNEPFCANCGTPASAPAPSPNTAPAPVVDTPVADQQSQTTAGNNKTLIIAIVAIVAVVAVIALVLVLTSLGGGKSDAKKLLNSYGDAIIEEDVDLYMSVYSPTYIDYMVDDYEEYGSWYGYDDYEEFVEEYLGEYLEELEDEYGNDLKFSFKITETKELDEDDIEDIEDEMDEEYGDNDKIEKAYEVEFEYTLKGDDDDDEDDGEMTMIQVDGEWYIYELDIVLV